MMLAQRKVVSWEYPEKKQIVERKNEETLDKEMNLNNALRSRCIILFVVVSLLAGFFILRSGIAASNAYQLNQIKNQATKLEAENSRLHLEIAHLKSPERIQSIATKDLGMILPDKFFFATKTN